MWLFFWKNMAHMLHGATGTWFKNGTQNSSLGCFPKTPKLDTKVNDYMVKHVAQGKDNFFVAVITFLF